MRYKAQILTTWRNDGAGNLVPDAGRLLQAGDSVMDISGEPAPVDTPHPTPVMVEVWGSDATLAAIEADANHGADAILSTEEVPDEA